MSFGQDDLTAFFTKSDFDFSTTAGWADFLAERRRGGSGREADGVQLRDLKNYSVGVANIITSGNPVRVHFSIRQPGSGLALAPATLFVNYPDASGARQVKVFSIGGSRQSLQNEVFEAGGGGTGFSPHWDVIYYIILKVDDLPGLDLLAGEGEKVLEESLKSGSWLLRRGFKLLQLGGASYDITVTVGGLAPSRNEFMDQQILSSETMSAVQDKASEAWDYLMRQA